MLVVAAQLGCLATATAQSAPRASSPPSAAGADALPEAPTPHPSAAAAQPVTPNPSIAPRFAKYIEPGQQAMRLSGLDKTVIGIKNAFAPSAILVWALVAGYEQAADDSPNFPLNKAGYFRRAGCEGARDASDNIFADSIFAPIFHQDPRYYQIGRRRNLVYRAVYAASRALVTRTDGGHLAPNVSLISGTVVGSLLTNAYYPTINQGLDATAKTFGGSMGSASLGFLAVEFGGDLLEALHLRHAQ